MSLGEVYIAYLRARSRAGVAEQLGDALAGAGLDTEAELWRAWCFRASTHAIAAGPWAGRQAHIGPRPPALAAVGELWFDVCELSAMIHVGRAWLSTRPVAGWQMAGFLAAAELVEREVQVAPPYQAFDAARVAGAGTQRITNVSEGEATLYGWWFGKGLPHLFDWRGAESSLPGTAMRELWQRSSREWTTNRLADDEAARVFVTPSTIQWKPDQVAEEEQERPESRRAMIRGELTRDPEIGFRTAVVIQTGLLTHVSSWQAIPEPVRLVSLVDRSAFA